MVDLVQFVAILLAEQHA